MQNSKRKNNNLGQPVMDMQDNTRAAAAAPQGAQGAQAVQDAPSIQAVQGAQGAQAVQDAPSIQAAQGAQGTARTGFAGGRGPPQRVASTVPPAAALRGNLSTQMQVVLLQLGSVQSKLDTLLTRTAGLEKQMALLSSRMGDFGEIKSRSAAGNVAGSAAFPLHHHHKRSGSSSSVSSDGTLSDELTIQQIMTRSKRTHAASPAGCKPASFCLFPEDHSAAVLRVASSNDLRVPTGATAADVSTRSPHHELPEGIILREPSPGDPEPNYDEEWSVLAPTPQPLS